MLKEHHWGRGSNSWSDTRRQYALLDRLASPFQHAAGANQGYAVCGALVLDPTPHGYTLTRMSRATNLMTKASEKARKEKKTRLPSLSLMTGLQLFKSKGKSSTRMSKHFKASSAEIIKKPGPRSSHKTESNSSGKVSITGSNWAIEADSGSEKGCEIRCVYLTVFICEYVYVLLGLLISPEDSLRISSEDACLSARQFL